jgi:hypothetical protein
MPGKIRKMPEKPWAGRRLIREDASIQEDADIAACGRGAARARAFQKPTAAPRGGPLQLEPASLTEVRLAERPLFGDISL